MIRFLLCLIAFVAIAETTFAQCPGGICPGTWRSRARPVRQTVTVAEAVPQVEFYSVPVTYVSAPAVERVLHEGDTKYINGQLHYVTWVNGKGKWLPAEPAPMPQPVRTVSYETPYVPEVSPNLSLTDIPKRPGHWSYPGDLASHLQSTHGVSTAGLSRKQLLDLHDYLHESNSPVIRSTSTSYRRGFLSRIFGR